ATALPPGDRGHRQRGGPRPDYPPSSPHGGTAYRSADPSNLGCIREDTQRGRRRRRELMFDLGTPVWQIAVRAAVVYVGVFGGHPTVLVEHGALVTGTLRRQGLDEDDVMMAAREHGLERLSDVDLAVLETDGSISVVPTSAPALRTPRRRARTLKKHG